MREIKFRAKGIEEYDKDKWYHGYYIKLDKTTYCFKEDYERSKNNSEHKIVFDVMTDWGLPNQHKMADINIDTLGQFTGLYDKNNTPIYEGDIINNKDILEDANYEVIFDNGAFYGKRKNYYFPEKDVFLKLYRVNKEDIEVIGNIFDNEEDI